MWNVVAIKELWKIPLEQRDMKGFEKMVKRVLKDII